MVRLIGTASRLVGLPGSKKKQGLTFLLEDAPTEEELLAHVPNVEVFDVEKVFLIEGGVGVGGAGRKGSFGSSSSGGGGGSAASTGSGFSSGPASPSAAQAAVLAAGGHGMGIGGQSDYLKKILAVGAEESAAGGTAEAGGEAGDVAASASTSKRKRDSDGGATGNGAGTGVHFQHLYTFVRRRTQDGLSSFGETSVDLLDGVKIERKKIIAAREYKKMVSRQPDRKRQRLFERRLCFLWGKTYFTIALFMNVEEDGFRVHSHMGKGGLCLLRVQPPEMGEGKEGGVGAAGGAAGPETEGKGRAQAAKPELRIPPFLKVRKEVTRDPQYHSRYLSLKDKSKWVLPPHLSHLRDVVVGAVKRQKTKN